MRIVVAGSRGLLGTDCLRVLSRRHDVTGMDLPELDIADRACVASVLDRLNPEAIVNCAAFADVDACETRRDLAHSVNATGAGNLARHAAARGWHLVHISTDYVFDGKRPRGEAYEESDPVGPAGYYGQSKLDGEREILEAGGPHTILRTAWMYGGGGRSFLRTILRKAVADPAVPLRIVSDQSGSPTWSRRLAEQIERVVAARRTGLYHAAGEGACTWFDLGGRFLRGMGIPAVVQPCPSSEYPRPAPRPANSALCCRRLAADGISVLRPWQEDLDAFVRTEGADLLNRVRESTP